MCIVVYQGSKLFWRTRNTIDITIVQHDRWNITEVIAYEPSINVEAKRIYLNSSILRTKLDQVEIDSKFSFAKQNNVPISTEFTDSVMNHAITDFLLSRLIISEFAKDECRFEVNLIFRDGDQADSAGGNNIREIVCAKPAELQPYHTKNHKLLAPGEAEAALQALQEEQYNLEITCTRAAALEVEASVPLTVKQRWRIPIVLVKLNKGKVLDAEDAKIWERVSRNFMTTEGIERVTTATVENVTSPEQQAAKKTTQIPLKSFREVVEAVKPQYQQLDLTKVRGAGAGGSVQADCKTVRIGAKLEHSDSRHRPMESPARSPMPTPRAISRANSSRLLAGTATSQARVQCAAEDSHPTPKTAHKKMVKRGSTRVTHGNSTSHNNSATNSKNNSRSNSRSNSKRFPHVNARLHLSGPRDAGDASQEDSAGPEVDLSEWEGSPGIAGNTRERFVGMVAAQLSTLATAVSSKFKSSSGQPSSVKMEKAVSEGRTFGEVSNEAVPVPVLTSPPDSARVTGTAPTVELVSSLPRQLSGLISFLKSGKSSSRSLQSVKSNQRDECYGPEESIPMSGNHATAAAGPQCNPVITEGAPGREETMSERVQGGAVPGKRRSYFGTLLASLVRANSGHAEAYVTTGANSGPLLTLQTEVANRRDKIKPTGLTSWLPWSHTTASSATVVPVNLAEYTRAQFAE